MIVPDFESGLVPGDYWQTPEMIRQPIEKIAAHPLYDPCPALPLKDGLNTDWGKSAFVNPPYSRGQLEKWAHKAEVEMSKATEQVFWLINYGATLNRLAIKSRAVAIIDLHLRIAFIDPSTGDARRGNDRDSVIYLWSRYAVNRDRICEAFEGIGEVFVKGSQEGI